MSYTTKITCSSGVWSSQLPRRSCRKITCSSVCEAHNCQETVAEKRKGKVWVSVCSFFPSELKRETSFVLAAWAKEVTCRIFDAIGRKQRQQQEQSSLLVLNCYSQFTIRLAEHQDARGGQNPSCLTPQTLCTGLIRSTIQRGNL